MYRYTVRKNDAKKNIGFETTIEVGRPNNMEENTPNRKLILETKYTRYKPRFSIALATF